MASAPTNGPGARRRLLVGLGGGLVVAAVAVAAVAAGGTSGTVGGELVAADVEEDEGSDGRSGGTDPDVEAARLAQQEADRIAAEQAGFVAELEERRQAAEAERQAEQEAAEAERQAEQEAAEADRQAEQEAAEAERRAEQEAAEAERVAEEAQQQLVHAQERLIELGYLVGGADGEQGQQTTSAVMAFQAVNGLRVDGVLGPQTLEVLEAPRREPQLRSGPANRVEVDMDLQVLHLVEGDRRVTTMKTSTGRGGTFESEAGETLRAETPVGTFTIDRRIAGEHQSSYGIGGMWDPMYFHGPWAIHGSPNVPAGPASAGCVRLAMADGAWLFDRVPNGTHVVLYGGTHVFTP
jgi:hypothetical protein